MRIFGTVGLFVGIFGALFGLAYSAFVLLREGTFLAERPIATAGPSTVRVPVEASRPYWAEVDLASTTPITPANADLAIPIRARVLDASGRELRVADVRADARTWPRVRIPPVVAATTGELTYEIELGGSGRGDITLERARLIVYRSSREEIIAGLAGALVAIAVGGILFRIAKRRAEPAKVT